MKVYGISGKKMSGKDTFHNFAVELLVPDNIRVNKISFARPLKLFCQEYLGCKERNLFGSDFDKNQWINTWSIFSEDIRKKYNKGPEDQLSAREILQVVGTDIFRKNFGEDFWTDIAIRKLEEAKEGNLSDVVFVTDVRFPNEMKALQDFGGKIIKIYRNIKREDTIKHESEIAMDKIPDEEYDYVVYGDANRSMQQLKESVFKILYHEGFFSGGQSVN